MKQRTMVLIVLAPVLVAVAAIPAFTTGRQATITTAPPATVAVQEVVEPQHVPPATSALSEAAEPLGPTTTEPAPTTTVDEPEPVYVPPNSVANPGPVGAIGSGACGRDLPPCSVMGRESGGDIRIWNGVCYAPVGWAGDRSPCGGSTASGKWQFIRSTWAGYGGYLNAADAPENVQDEKARLVWAGGAGCSHWDAC